jgi:hypothetical protein
MTVISNLSNTDVSGRSTGSNPFTELILDFRGKNLPSEQIKADYNNTLNYPLSFSLYKTYFRKFRYYYFVSKLPIKIGGSFDSR